MNKDSLVLSVPQIDSDIYNIEMMDLGGMPLFRYSLENLKEAFTNSKIYVETESAQVRDLCKQLDVDIFSNIVNTSNIRKINAYQPFLYTNSNYKLPYIYRNLIVNSHANYMMANYIVDCLDKYKTLKLIKQQKAYCIVNHSIDDQQICLIGDSLIEYWSIDTLAGFKVFNAGIGDLTTSECLEWIVTKLDISRFSKFFIIVGTNDIKYKLPLEDIVHNVKTIIKYIEHQNSKAQIIYSLVPNVRRRWDRRNDDINRLNKMLVESLCNKVKLIYPTILNNPYGELDESNTIDGLHLSELGYEKIKQLIELQLLKYENI